MASCGCALVAHRNRFPGNRYKLSKHLANLTQWNGQVLLRPDGATAGDPEALSGGAGMKFSKYSANLTQRNSQLRLRPDGAPAGDPEGMPGGAGIKFSTHSVYPQVAWPAAGSYDLNLAQQRRKQIP